MVKAFPLPLPWQLMIYLCLDRFLQDERKRSYATLLPSEKAVFQSIQQHKLLKTILNADKAYFLSLKFSLVFHQKVKVVTPAMKVSVEATDEALSK